MGLLAKLNPITAVIGMFCDIPGSRYWFPIIYPIVNIPALISCFIPILLSVIYSSANYINARQNEKGEWEKDTNYGSKWAFLIYYVISCLVAFYVMGKVCKVVNYI
jgi:hypothetical protein